MTLIPSLTFTELREVSMEHSQRVWLARKECLPFRTPGSVPFFGTCLCSNCWDQFAQTCRVFWRLFTLNTRRYFLDFAWVIWHNYIMYLFNTTFIPKDLRTLHILIFLSNCSSIKTKRRRSDSILWKKPLHKRKCKKGKVTTQTTPQKSSIKQRLRTYLGRSVGVTTATQLFKINGCTN